MSKIGTIYENYKQGGIRHVGTATLDYIRRTLIKPTSIYAHNKLSKKINIFNSEWDMLIILDTARPDALAPLADEYQFLPNNIATRWSSGGASPEWMMNTFHTNFEDIISRTAYISSNPYTELVIEYQMRDISGLGHGSFPHLQRFGNKDITPAERFYTVVDLSQKSEVNNDLPFVSPRTVTDNVINIDRNESPERIIAHYMPPHQPYVTKVKDGKINFVDRRPDTSFNAYLDNLRWGLNEVDLLLDNVDRNKVIITADHGENFRWRENFPTHDPGMLLPSVRVVPWVETKAVDSKQYTPEFDKKFDEVDKKETLDALGYL